MHNHRQFRIASEQDIGSAESEFWCMWYNHNSPMNSSCTILLESLAPDKTRITPGTSNYHAFCNTQVPTSRPQRVDRLDTEV
ncbi:unnamed protein product [Protopolystoma xenopodis]|uniref:Uncharacterized protein n=1 Tax=Protopolystoma xenopodis TaxID=117903 RepID=A0A3S4ZZK1_9PLAT|nr:unnamed protein product [Protopolystoma xenopodis]